MYLVQKKYCLLQKQPFKIIGTWANKATQKDVFSGRRFGPTEQVNITGTDQPGKASFKKKYKRNTHPRRIERVSLRILHK
jgi:hypothetical protein